MDDHNIQKNVCISEDIIPRGALDAFTGIAYLEGITDNYNNEPLYVTQNVYDVIIPFIESIDKLYDKTLEFKLNIVLSNDFHSVYTYLHNQISVMYEVEHAYGRLANMIEIIDNNTTFFKWNKDNTLIDLCNNVYESECDKYVNIIVPSAIATLCSEAGYFGIIDIIVDRWKKSDDAVYICEEEGGSVMINHVICDALVVFINSVAAAEYNKQKIVETIYTDSLCVICNKISGMILSIKCMKESIDKLYKTIQNECNTESDAKLLDRVDEYLSGVSYVNSLNCV
jgi:hypothetical protein